MKVLIDLNVMLDFLQRREPFFDDAACVIDAVLYGRADGVLPAHGVTTIHHFLARGIEKQRAAEVIRWILNTFEVASCGKDLLLAALALPMPDYEDAVTALAAERVGCSHVVTRNIRDFVGSPVPAVLPADLLALVAG
jgi:predicted nucleic acid-binding protein